ncbi:MAG TPA: hypothetical protein VGA47_00910 [Candidatus Dormibacteraeota bacterium]
MGVDNTPAAFSMGLRTLFALVLVGLGFSSGWFRSAGGDTAEGVLRSVAVAIGFVWLVSLARRQIHHHVKQLAQTDRSARDTDVPFEPDVAWLIKRRRDTADDVNSMLDKGDADTIPAFVELLINPAKYRARTVETISLEGRVIRQRVSVEYALPDWPSSSNDSMIHVPIPVLTPLKGELIDGFNLFGADGNSLADLSYEETVKLMSVALRLLMLVACLPKEQPLDNGVELSPKATEAELALLQAISRRGRIAPQDAARVVSRGLDLLSDDISDEEGIEQLKKFVTALATAYPIVAFVPVEQSTRRILVKYERTLIPKTSIGSIRGSFKRREYTESIRATTDRLRLLLGLRPYQVGIPLALPLTTQSHHLSIIGPADQYLGEQRLRCRKCLELLSRTWRATSESLEGCNHEASTVNQDHYYRLRRRCGQNYAHVYMRGYANSGLRNLEVLVNFGETPTGALARAVVASGAAVILIAVIGRLVYEARGSLSSDVPALILAFPAIAASWFGFSSDSESLLRSSLASRLALLTSGLLSFLSAVLYLSQPHGTEVTPLGDPSGRSFSVLGVPALSWWAALLCLAIINLLYIGYRFLLVSTYYRTLLERDAEGDFYVRG